MNDEAIARFTDEDGDDNALPPEFATATMGHVLLGQGREAEARAVFTAVLARDPGEAEARRGIELLGAPAPTTVDTAEPAYVRALAMDPTTLVVHWSAPVGSLVHLTGDPAGVPLALLVTSLRAGPVGIFSQHRTVALGAREGELTLRGLDPGAVHHVALGARLGDRVVPFARAPGVAAPIEVPRPARTVETPVGGSPLAFEAAHARWAEGLAAS